MTERDAILRYRIRTIRVGLVVSWFGLLLFVLRAVPLDPASNTLVTITIVGFTTGLLFLSVAPWKTVLASPLGDLTIFVWSSAAIFGIFVHEMFLDGETNGVGFLLILLFAAATLLVYRGVVALGVTVAVTFTVTTIPEAAANVTTLAQVVLPFVAAVIFILLFSVGIKTQLAATETAYQSATDEGARLAHQERELTHLYQVSRTIGSGTKFDDVLPDLIRRVAESVDARIGLVLLYNADTECLELISPIWVAGHIVQADSLSLALDEPGVAQQVFTSGDARVNNDTSTGAEHDRLVTELGAERVALVAIGIGNRSIGVLLVGDKLKEFTDDDIGTLDAVAAPAALVLNQIAQFEEAQSISDRMAELAQLKTDFVAVVSHELRTPLTSIIGAIATLQRTELLPEDPRARQLIEMAGKQADRLRTLIEDLLVMSRIEADSLPVRPEQIDIAAFLVELLQGLPEGERVIHRHTGDIGEVHSDPDHLNRVITNLVENAFKYGGHGPIEIATSASQNEILISIIDHGPGIPHDQHDVIFDRFTQLQPHATRSKGGAGLGLSIVKGLVEAMGGRVWFEPTPGGGATFSVSIPTEIPTEIPTGPQ